ncbi:MAG: nicotinate-nucleotide adenylyltransferase [Lachnospiraceae bacterium]|nr:nicotinate-nucleotide adenylyltransferase [Lachnospiraceae bacterium]
MRRKKVGIMGGTFNPIHFGHLLLAETAYHQFNLDTVMIMPTKNPYYKKMGNSVTEQDRVNMVTSAIADNDHFILSKEELNRDGTTYTVDTLEALTASNPDTDYYFIMGEDSLYHIESWRNPERILELAVILVAARGGTSGSLMSQIEYIEDKFDGDIRLLEAPFLEISSNDIRRRVREEDSIRYMLPKSVIDYIYEKGLYKPDKE